MSKALFEFKEFKMESVNKDDSLNLPSDITNSPSEISNTKCGEVFTINYIDFALICSLCNSSYDNMFDFGEHLRQHHRSSNHHSSKMEILDNYSDCASEVDGKRDDLSIVDIQKPKSEILNLDEKECVCVFCKMSFRTFDCLEQHECDPEFLMGQELGSREPPEVTDAYVDLQANANEPVPTLNTCKICKKRYSCRSSLKRHKCCGFSLPPMQKTSKCEVGERNSEPGAYIPTITTCTDCNKPYESIEAFKRHRCLRNREGKSVLEKKTNKTNDPAEKLVENKGSTEEVISNAALYCEICDQHFKLSASLKSHAIVHEKAPIALRNSPGYLTCHTCDAKFSNHIEWIQHENSHSVPFRHKCPHCPKMCKTRATLNMHINSHTGARPFKCPKCPASFAHYANLSTHNKRIHLKHHPFACPFCDVRCVKNAELRFHMRKHTGEKPHQCDLCGKRFLQPVLLREHLKAHANIKDIQCPVCSMGFVTKKRLKEHMIKHSDERPHACDICGDKFSRRKAMIAHRKIHLPEKEYICRICGKAFAQHPGLYSHMKSHGIVGSDKSCLDV